MKTRLDEIRKRLEAATPGPWKHELPEGKYYGTKVSSQDEWLQFEIWSGPGDNTPKPSERFLERTGYTATEFGAEWGWDHYEDQQDFSNAEFIAHCPTDIAFLLNVASAAEEMKSLLKHFQHEQQEVGCWPECPNCAAHVALEKYNKLMEGK